MTLTSSLGKSTASPPRLAQLSSAPRSDLSNVMRRVSVLVSRGAPCVVASALLCLALSCLLAGLKWLGEFAPEEGRKESRKGTDEGMRE